MTRPIYRDILDILYLLALASWRVVQRYVLKPFGVVFALVVMLAGIACISVMDAVTKLLNNRGIVAK